MNILDLFECSDIYNLHSILWHVLILCFTELRGLLKQPTIGFLTILEHMRYCEVSSLLNS